MDGNSKEDGKLYVVANHEGFMFVPQPSMASLWKHKWKGFGSLSSPYILLSRWSHHIEVSSSSYRMYLCCEWLPSKLFVCHRLFNRLVCYFGLGISLWSRHGCYEGANGLPIQFIVKRPFEMCALSISYVWRKIKSSHPPGFSLTRINMSCLVPQNVIINMLGLERAIKVILTGDLNIVMLLSPLQKLHILILCVNCY